MQGVRPMLAYSDPVRPSDIPVSSDRPVWLSPKLDGFRCLAANSKALSRTLKPFPNKFVQAHFNNPALHGLDGELVVGPPTAPNCINATTSGINSQGGEPDFGYYVFDCWYIPNVGFRQRYGWVKRRVAALRRRGFKVFLVPQRLCHTVEEIEAAVDEFYQMGYEGGIARTYNDRYKYNRSTLKEGYLLKIKEFCDAEIRVTGFVEMTHNTNEAKLDERGLTKRSTHKANKTSAGTLGNLLGIDTVSGLLITIGTGKMSAEEKLHVWQNQEAYLGSFAKYRYAPHGVKDLPRHPRFIVWRPAVDI